MILAEILQSKELPKPSKMGSYDYDDVVFLFKDISSIQLEVDTEDREEKIQNGIHYSEMLPVEYKPSPAYLELFHKSLKENAQKVALAAATVAELIRLKRGENIVLASLARAGTPIGVLLKKYLSFAYKIVVPHYSISIIRGKGIDENAILYMIQNHPTAFIQFVDGWTGKGAISLVLKEACKAFKDKFGYELSDDLAVLADPGHCVATFGTREDFIIPSACLNSTVSGLVSRTVHREDLIGENDYHGAKYYSEWANEDVSKHFIESVCNYFPSVVVEAKKRAQELYTTDIQVPWKGLRDIKAIQQEFSIDDVNLIKPGVGETTRVLLRRVPWKILIDREDNPYLEHILLLARDREVPVEVFPDLTYSCCGLINQIKKMEANA
ncbi:cysteine protease StiP family protein [Brevibacillus sp. SYSU BS000544]|uniref:cysteine protease StiP family protein n=1 Tax=Brevibacillus sp. SYSU BS000544 TaxID=3416443 RepID=UPI003CE4691B